MAEKINLNDHLPDINKINVLKEEYLNTEIPDELDSLVNNIIKSQKTNHKLNGKMFRASAAMILLVLTFGIGVNAVPVFASAMYEIPIIGTLAKILTIKSYFVNNEQTHVNIEIETPVITGLDNQELETALNQQYSDASKKLYDDFMAELGLGHDSGSEIINKSINSGYSVVVNTEKLLVLSNYTIRTAGSSEEKIKYTNIDLKNGVILTLQDLFCDQSYIETINTEIKNQMALDPDKYFSGDDAFKTISPEQNFYLNEHGTLVIAFDKYEVAAGYVGPVQFEIPTESLKDILLSDEYIH